MLIAPLMPGINDSPAQVEKILELATEAGATYVAPIALHLRGEVRQLFFEWLAEHRPDLVTRYRELYRNGAYAPQQERKRLARLVAGAEREPFQTGRVVRQTPPEPARPAPLPRQGTLFEAAFTVKPSGPGGDK